ncbi:MAG: hypothetical protein IPL12_08055 [Bacteroidetes bacterium]|nr:hypothetical protein [Bacteroidota bacterium]
MKNITKKIPLFKTTIFVVLIAALALSYAGSNTKIIANFLSINNEINQNAPDSIIIETDTINDTYEVGDTMDIDLAGMDTLFILYEDTTNSNIDSLNDTETFRVFDANKDITITPGGVTHIIPSGLFGIHIEGMFSPKHLPEDSENVNYPNSWMWLADLKPKVLRFPGGASSRWMHCYLIKMK